MGTHALVLNASFEPLHIVSWQRGIQLLFQGKVEVVEESEWVIRTVSTTFKVPAVIRLLKYIPMRRRHQMIRFSRANVFIRDQYTCQYCGRKAPKNHLTLDHVVPVVQGGQKTWHNIVTCCQRCNQTKGGRSPSEAGMSLIRRPREPMWLPTLSLSLSLGIATLPEKWKVYLKVDVRTTEIENSS